jgi:hypothetical protein
MAPVYCPLPGPAAAMLCGPHCEARAAVIILCGPWGGAGAAAITLCGPCETATGPDAIMFPAASGIGACPAVIMLLPVWSYGRPGAAAIMLCAF